MPAPPPDAAGIASAVVVAAGRGDRFGAPDKVLLPLAGRPLLAHVLDAVQAAVTVREVVVVAGSHTRGTIEALSAAGPWTKVRAVVEGGQRRQDSVARGVAATDPDLPIVAVHDGARPLATADLVDRCVRAALAVGVAIAAVPVTDTIKRVRDHRVLETVPRHDLWAAQTPQAFRRSLGLRACADEPAITATFTDEAALFEALGQPVTIVPGDRFNLKITVPDDLALAEAMLRARSAAPTTRRSPRADR